MGCFGRDCPCCAPSLGGRIIASKDTNRSTLCDNYYGMAPTTRGRKYLVCFYCNKKSDIKYDGLITQWDCARCEASNYLDENGDITDPPVATAYESPAPADLKYSITRPDSPVSQASSQGGVPTFCSTCLKNQHLLTASLAQFHVEIDPSHPKYKESEDKYFAYRRNLEKRYPQCCEDCEAKALERMREADKTAKSDWLRRLMDKSRTRKSAVKGGGFTLGGLVDFMGKFLWYMGLIGQLLWNIFTVAGITEHHVTTLDSSLLPFVATSLSTVSEISSYVPAGTNLAFWGLACSLFSLWWNPKFQNLNKGFMNHVTGYGKWYANQATLFAIRCLFYFVMAREGWADEITAAAHGFIFVFTTFLVIRSHRFIKVNMERLWNSTPEKIPFVGPSGSPKQSVNSLESVLNELGASPPRNSRPAFTPSPPSFENFRPQPYQPGSIRVGHNRSTAPIQSLKALDLSSFRGRTTPPLTKNTYASASGSQPPLDQQNSGLNLGASMDWSPSQPASQPKSQHRAFTENLPVDKDAEFFGRIPIQKQPTKLFGQSPVAAQSSPFWYKVPPAPITPAHQLRNPPNQPRMRVASQEQKENFFNNVTRGSHTWGKSSETTDNGNNGSQRQRIEFAQQKFFNPPVPSQEHDVLADAFKSWSLADSSRSENIEVKNTRRIWQGVVVLTTIGVGFFCFRNGIGTSMVHEKWLASSG